MYDLTVGLLARRYLQECLQLFMSALPLYHIIEYFLGYTNYNSYIGFSMLLLFLGFSN